MVDPKKYYLDFNATAPIPEEVTAAVAPFIGTSFGNPSSRFNPYGKEAFEAIDTARGAIARLLGLDPADIVFTAGGTESCFAAFVGRMLGLRGVRGGRVVISSVEHPAVIEAARLTSVLFDVEVVEVGVDNNGQLKLDELKKSLTPDTRLVSVMAANNETGILLQIAEVVQLAAAHGIPVHTDATNFVGKLPCDFKQLGVSFISMSAHKIGGLKGVGVLGISAANNAAGGALAWSPVIKGGGQESGRRGGTENVAGIVSLGSAATLKLAQLRDGAPSRLSAQRDSFEQQLKTRLPGLIEINGEAVPRLPNTSSVRFKGVTATELIVGLAERGVYVSAGSACKTDSVEISHVLKAMGVPFTAALGVIRFSFGEIFTESELEELVDIVVDEVDKNRRENLKLTA